MKATATLPTPRSTTSCGLSTRSPARTADVSGRRGRPGHLGPGRRHRRPGHPQIAKNRNPPGWTRTTDLGIRNLRRGDFNGPEETTKSTVSLCPSTTSGSTSDFASTTNFTAQRAEKVADLRNPQIRLRGLRGRRQGVHGADVEGSDKLERCRRFPNGAEDLIHDHLELIKQKWADHLG